MTLNAPRVLFFIVSLIIALIGVLSVFIATMAQFPNQAFWLMTIAYVILALACIVKSSS